MLFWRDREDAAATSRRVAPATRVTDQDGIAGEAGVGCDIDSSLHAWQEIPVDEWNDAVMRSWANRPAVAVSSSEHEEDEQLAAEWDRQLGRHQQESEAELQMAHDLAARMGLNEDGRRAFTEGFLQSQVVQDID